MHTFSIKIKIKPNSAKIAKFFRYVKSIMICLCKALFSSNLRKSKLIIIFT